MCNARSQIADADRGSQITGSLERRRRSCSPARLLDRQGGRRRGRARAALRVRQVGRAGASAAVKFSDLRFFSETLSREMELAGV